MYSQYYMYGREQYFTFPLADMQNVVPHCTVVILLTCRQNIIVVISKRGHKGLSGYCKYVNFY